jgi:FAD/FMN-containing dehydrogenase
VFIVPLYGAVSRVRPGDTAFALRQPGYELDIMGRWTAPPERDTAVRWVDALRKKLQPFARGVYGNQLGETSEELVRAVYGPNYKRLAQIKRKYDPKNVLRLNQNIKPS